MPSGFAGELEVCIWPANERGGAVGDNCGARSVVAGVRRGERDDPQRPGANSWVNPAYRKGWTL